MKSFFFIRSKRGMALLIVLGCLVLISGLILAFLENVKTDHKISFGFASEMNVKQLTTSCENFVIAQIRDATQCSGGESWASQPGMIRTYNSNGALSKAYKLYSSDQMQTTSFKAESEMESLSAWADSPALYTDLNEPIQDTYPIVDPRAIDYNDTQGKASLNSVDQFKIVGAPRTLNQELPMPVKWIYLLRDGQIAGATIDKTGDGRTVKVAGATLQNPIVGRMAFWTDDETCKVNLNTASEGIYYDTPMVASQDDFNLSWSPPHYNEYQRQGGHPAMVCLSSVLSGFVGGPDASSNSLSESDKSSLKWFYGMTPQIKWGGSQGGTQKIPRSLFAQDDPGQESAPITLDKDKPFTYVDEVLFKTLSNMDGGAKSLNHEVVERVNFFLTTCSKAPEVTMFNLPRVTLWPVDDPVRANPATPLNYLDSRYLNRVLDDNKDQRSPFDKKIELASTLNGHPYYFTRSNPLSPSEDWTKRNLELYSYLQKMMEKNVPGFGGAFNTKYGRDYLQILTGICDYIRCINPMDTSAPLGGTVTQIAPTVDRYARTVLSANQGPANFLYSYSRPPGYQPVSEQSGTYQAGKYFALGTGDVGSSTKRTSFGLGVPGEGGTGQIVPIKHPNGTKGFGRFPVLSQIGISVIANGANQPPMAPGGAAGSFNFWHPFSLAISNTTGAVNSGNIIVGSPDGRNYYILAGGRAISAVATGTSAFPPPNGMTASGNYVAAEWGNPPNGAWKEDASYSYFSQITGAIPYPTTYNWSTSVSPLASYTFPATTPVTHPGFDSTLGRYQTRLSAMILFELQYPFQGYPYTACPDFRIRIKNLDRFQADSQFFGFPSDATETLCRRFDPDLSDRPSTSLLSFVTNLKSRALFPSNPGANAPFAYPFFGLNMKTPMDPGGTGGATVNGTGGPIVGGPARNFFNFTGGTIIVEIHSMPQNPGNNDYWITGNSEDTLIQSYTITFPDSTWPIPKLSGLPAGTAPSVSVYRPLFETCSFAGRIPNSAAGCDPSCSYGGRIGWLNATVKSSEGYSSSSTSLFLMPQANTASAGTQTQGTAACDTIDVVRSMQLTTGDFRYVAGMKNVPASEFTKHPNYDDSLRFSAHSFRSENGGFFQGGGNAPKSIDGAVLATGACANNYVCANNGSNLWKTSDALPSTGSMMIGFLDSSTGYFNNNTPIKVNLVQKYTFNYSPFLGYGVNPYTRENKWSGGGDYDTGGTLAMGSADGGYLNYPDNGQSISL
ncbi:MAG: Verru_Chthon cassette protein A, partial [Verrucomicrobiota bacterium]